MATFGGLNIIRDGLVLYLDGANTKSYPTSGTTWSDLSGSGNNGTLTNGPTFSSANGGSLVFDGVDDYVNLPLSTNLQTTSYTIFGYVKSNIIIQNGSPEMDLFYYRGTTNGTNRFGVLFGFSSNAVSNTGRLNLVIGNGAWNIYTSSRSSWSANTWYNIAVTQTGTTYRMYVGGVETDSGTAVVPIFSGMDINRFGFFWNGNIANGMFYNRALSASEVLQNYEATKSRYNL